jgi:hypothetical protein
MSNNSTVGQLIVSHISNMILADMKHYLREEENDEYWRYRENATNSIKNQFLMNQSKKTRRRSREINIIFREKPNSGRF